MWVPSTTPWTKPAWFFELSPQCILSKELVSPENVFTGSIPTKIIKLLVSSLASSTSLTPCEEQGPQSCLLPSCGLHDSQQTLLRKLKGNRQSLRQPCHKATPHPNAFIFLTHYHQPDCPRNLSKTFLLSTYHLQSTWILKTYPVPSFEISLMATERILWTGFPRGITDFLYPLLLKIPMHGWGLRAVSPKCLSSSFYPFPSAAQTLATLLTSSTSTVLGKFCFQVEKDQQTRSRQN